MQIFLYRIWNLISTHHTTIYTVDDRVDGDSDKQQKQMKFQLKQTMY